MKDWPEGEIRRVEHAYSPKLGCYGYYILGAFIKNIPMMLQEIVEANRDEVLLIQCDGKRQSQQSGHPYYTFKIIGRYSYETLPDQYKDCRGQYPPDFKTRSWDEDNFYVTGFPVRPWVKHNHPCSSDEFYSMKEEEKRRMRGRTYRP